MKLSKNTILRSGVVLCLILAAVVLRLYSARVAPILPDEREVLSFTKKNVSFNWNDLRLPIGGVGGDNGLDCPPMPFYMITVSGYLFGTSQPDYRMLFVLLGIVSIFLFYKITDEYVGKDVALIALFLLTFSQFHIALSRMMLGEILLVFFASLALLFFFRLIRTEKKKYYYLTAAAVGVGYNGRELILLLLPAFLLFILIEKLHLLKRRITDVILALLTMLLCMTPSLVWSFQHRFSNYSTDGIFMFGVSLRVLFMYFAELFTAVVEKSQWFFWDITDASKIYYVMPEGNRVFIDEISNEFPFVFWPLSLLIFAAVVRGLWMYRKSTDYVKFLVIMFCVVFVLATVMAGAATIFDQHTWGSLSFYPGVILAAALILDVCRRNKYIKYFAVILSIVYIVHGVSFVRLPDSCYAAPPELESDCYLDRAKEHMLFRDYASARRVLGWTIKKGATPSQREKARRMMGMLIEQEAASDKKNER